MLGIGPLELLVALGALAFFVVIAVAFIAVIVLVLRR